MKTMSIGRDESCNIIVTDPSNLVSRRHATLTISRMGKMTLTDTSTNGTYINGIKISSNVPVPVTRKDVVSFAHVSELNWKQVPKGEATTMILTVASVIVILACVAFLAKALIQKSPSNPKSGDQKAVITDTITKDAATQPQAQPVKEYKTEVEVEKVKETITTQEATDSIESLRNQMKAAEDSLAQVKILVAKADSLYNVKYGNKDKKYADAIQRASFLIGGCKQAIDKQLDAAAVYNAIEKAETINGIRNKSEDVAGALIEALNNASEKTACFAKLVSQFSPDLKEAIQKLSTITDPEPEAKAAKNTGKGKKSKRDKEEEKETPVESGTNVTL